METSLRRMAIRWSKEAAILLLAIVSAVLLPQLCHEAGVALGVGGTIGQICLPMYLPVLIVGFCRGRVSGAIVGLAAPLVSFALTAMPQEALLPYVTLELMATGWLAGAFANVKLPAVLRVLSVQAIAKAIRLGAFAVGLYVLNGAVTASEVFAGVWLSLPGVALQLVLVPWLIGKKGQTHDE